MDKIIWYQYKDFNGNQIITQDYDSLPMEIKQSKNYKEIEIPQSELEYIYKYYNIWFTYVFDSTSLTIKSDSEQIDDIKNYQKSVLDNILYDYLFPTDWVIVKISEQTMFETQEYIDYLKNKYQNQIQKRKRLRDLQLQIENLINEQTSWKKIQYIISKMRFILDETMLLEDLQSQLDKIV